MNTDIPGCKQDDFFARHLSGNMEGFFFFAIGLAI